MLAEIRKKTFGIGLRRNASSVFVNMGVSGKCVGIYAVLVAKPFAVQYMRP